MLCVFPTDFLQYDVPPNSMAVYFHNRLTPTKRGFKAEVAEFPTKYFKTKERAEQYIRDCFTSPECGRYSVRLWTALENQVHG